MHNYIRLTFCVFGIYACFLTWGIIQERLTSISYPSVSSATIGDHRFRFFTVLNIFQGLFSATCAGIQCILQKSKARNNVKAPSLRWLYVQISLTGAIASSIGYLALNYISYPTMVLAKSAKLLPVLITGVLIYRRKYSVDQYISILLITLGVGVFMFGEGRGKAIVIPQDSWKPFIGYVLVIVTLCLDGLTNSAQDHLFSKDKSLLPSEVMLKMNLLSSLYLFVYLVGEWILTPATAQLPAAYHFIVSHPKALVDMILFSICGALGQAFIFLTLRHFGSLVLVTITITRKLFTVLLSVVWFSHKVHQVQWLGIFCIMVGIVIEAYAKEKEKKNLSKEKVV